VNYWAEKEQKAKDEGKAEGTLRTLSDLVQRGLSAAEAARAELDRLVAAGEVPEVLAADLRGRLATVH